MILSQQSSFTSGITNNEPVKAQIFLVVGKDLPVWVVSLVFNSPARAHRFSEIAAEIFRNNNFTDVYRLVLKVPKAALHAHPCLDMALAGGYRDYQLFW